MGLINYFDEKTKGFKNMGSFKLLESKIGVFRQFVIAPVADGGFATGTDALDETKWEDKFKQAISTRLFPIPKISTFTNKSTEDVYTEDLNGMKFSEEGKLSFSVEIDMPTILWANARGINGKRVKLYIADESQSVLGRTKDGVLFDGFDAIVRFAAPKFADAKQKVMSVMTVDFVDAKQWSEELAVIEPTLKSSNDWYPLTTWDGVHDVDLALSGVSATGCTLSVNIKGIATTNTQSFVDGLVKADLVQKSSVGAVKTITSSTGNGDGTYTIVSSIANGDTFNLVACSAISLTTYKIESTGAVTATV